MIALLRNPPHLDLPRFAVVDKRKCKDIAWFWERRLALAYIAFLQTPKPKVKGKP